MSHPGLITGGMPRVGTVYDAGHRIIFRAGWNEYLGGGKVIDGAKSRDPGNTPSYVLRAGLLMGKVTANSKYAPSQIGVMQASAIATATSITVTAAQAVELVRRVGATGTLRLTGPPAAAGVVATFTETYSAVDTNTGVITVSALDAALVAGSFVSANDGSYLPITVIPDGWGIGTVDWDYVTSLDQPFERMPIAGEIRSANILPAWPADASLRNWIRDTMNLAGKFEFDYMY